MAVEMDPHTQGQTQTPAQEQLSRAGQQPLLQAGRSSLSKDLLLCLNYF